MRPVSCHNFAASHGGVDYSKGSVSCGCWEEEWRASYPPASQWVYSHIWTMWFIEDAWLIVQLELGVFSPSPSIFDESPLTNFCEAKRQHNTKSIHVTDVGLFLFDCMVGGALIKCPTIHPRFPWFIQNVFLWGEAILPE